LSSYNWRLSDVDTSANDSIPWTKKRKTSRPTPIIISEPIKESVPIQDDPDQGEPENQMDLPNSPKETMDAPKPPNPLMTAEDPDDVVITGTGFSKPAATVLSKHVAPSSQTIPESGLSKAKLSEYENLEFKELYSGFASPRAANLQEDCVLMLKAIYTLTEQLYTGSVLTVKAVMDAKEPITSIKKVLGCLSTLPPRIGELTRSAARKGVLTALSRCLAYAPEINPEEVAAGFPQLKDDGSEFVEEDYQRVVKDSRLAATQLAASLDLSKYEAAYDSKNKKVNPPTFVTTSLTPRGPKNPFDLEADQASILTDEVDFAALAKCNWVLGDLQIEVGQSSQQNDPKAPTE
ncbi:hypothetical protein ZWY2020_032866, partial [Hordeum vulgare]